ncbi:sigma-54-dependent Fis family transcriptional regulator [Ensifer soli]|uniref:sigma-54-dependent Fis family transcriptional regulator n=1 Tax=Ciceribacter sp. sgz301302 TaxID=3342379 RepID=UPI0035B86D34
MQHLSGMDRARQALEKGDRFPAGALQPIVAESWLRCRDAGLDPRAAPGVSVIPFSDVRRRREAHAAVRRLAMAEMQLLHAQIAGSNFMIAFADPDGVVLDTISDQHFADSGAGRAIIPGSRWNENERGTNALGLVATARRPVAVYGREHYFVSHGHLSCMAAPVVGADGTVLGLLDASCAFEARQEHTHALVRMAAAQIENSLVFQHSSQSFVFAFHPRAEYLDTLSAGLLSVSVDGEVTSVNRAAQALLAGLPARLGARFDALFDARFGAAMDGLMGGGVIRVRDRAGSGVFMICRQIGQSQGAPSPKPAAAPPPMPSDAAPDFVSDDPALRGALKDLAEAVALAMPVLVTGETGTGKELMARHVHRLSRRKGAFVAVNCGAVPEDLFIAELFGHERGAFTNARSEGAPGLARAAHLGTLFLDEVADIPLAAQTALLRFLDGMEVRSVGASRTERVDVQIVSATNRDLEAMVAGRGFRADLLYRLNAFTVRLPPLGARSDLPAIVRTLVETLAPGTPVTDAAVAALSARPWPGNIRELKTVLQRALIRRRGDFLDEDCFDARPSQATAGDCCAECGERPLSRAKCQEIRAVHRQTGGNISHTAKRLGLSRTTVYKHVRP